MVIAILDDIDEVISLWHPAGEERQQLAQVRSLVNVVLCKNSLKG
jgi:hypothetical protein